MPKSKTKRTKIILALTAVVVVGTGVWYATRAKTAPAKVASSQTEATKSDANTDAANKNDPTMDKKSQTTTTASSSSKTLSVTISRPVNNDTLPLAEGIEIRSVISGATSGTCSVTATGPGGKTVTKNATIAAQPSYGSCSIDIASSEVVAGEWQVVLTATSGDASGKANVKVKVQ